MKTNTVKAVYHDLRAIMPGMSEEPKPTPPGPTDDDSLPEFLAKEDITLPADDANTIRIPRRPLYALIIPLAFVTGLAAGYVFWGRPGAAPAAAAESVAAEPVPLEPGEVRFDIDVDDDPSLGPADAPITIVEFSDFNCPYCKRFHGETFPSLLAAYPDQIHFVYRDFPVVGGFEAAQAAECANEQGAFWPFHDLLLSGTEPALNADAYGVYAEALGLDSQALLDCVASGKYTAEVETDARYASSLGVTGTPTFFINGIPLVGAQPIQAFQQVIDSELSN
jgi:protein-disulfide isomerase